MGHTEQSFLERTDVQIAPNIENTGSSLLIIYIYGNRYIHGKDQTQFFRTTD